MDKEKKKKKKKKGQQLKRQSQQQQYSESTREVTKYLGRARKTAEYAKENKLVALILRERKTEKRHRISPPPPLLYRAGAHVNIYRSDDRFAESRERNLNYKSSGAATAFHSEQKRRCCNGARTTEVTRRFILTYTRAARRRRLTRIIFAISYKGEARYRTENRNYRPGVRR